MRVKVKAGGRAFTPLVLFVGYQVTRRGWFGILGADAVYELPVQEEDDWQKFAGGVFADNPLELILQYPMTYEGRAAGRGYRNAAMLGWRWNARTEMFELTSYLHVNGARIVGKDGDGRPVMTVARGEKFAYWLEVDYDGELVTTNIQRESDMARFRHTQIFPGLGDLMREVNGWFGGTLPAPRALAYHKTRITVWIDNRPDWGYVEQN